MSNEVKKPNNGASEVSVARYLIQQFPEWEEQLNNLLKLPTSIGVMNLDKSIL